MIRLPARHKLVVALIALVLALVAGCSKPHSVSGVNPGENPADQAELDRLQRIINDRPDLEVVKRQLSDLDGQIRAAIAKYSPATVIDPATPKVGHGCQYPFWHNIGDSYGTETSFGRPAPTQDEWTQISAEVEPALKAAGFHLNLPTNIVTPLSSDPMVRDDDATINLINRPGGNNVLDLSYNTGCHLPVAWRTGQPPQELRPPSDPGVHYPYLYAPPGGRTAPPS
jgi:hypothetical protein